MVTWMKSVLRWRELVLILAQRNLKVRYKGSALGFFWSLLAPLFMILIYAVFLRVMLSFDSSPLFLPRLVTGIVCWQFLALCVGDSMNTVLGSASLVKKTTFPRLVLPAAMVLANTVNFLLSAVVLVIYLLLAPGTMAAWGWFPLVLAFHIALCMGLGSLFSALNVHYRDTEHAGAVFMMAWFFLSPVIYTIDRIPEALRPFAYLNPMTGILTAYRQILLSEPGPDPFWCYALSALVCALALCIGLRVFSRLQRTFAEAL